MASHAYIIWISVFAYAFHIFEEFVFNWRDWAESTLTLKVSWPIFYVANATVMIAGISTAMVGWDAPAFALIIPALQLINGLLFHIFPTIVQRRFSPGVITSVLLFLPIATWAYVGANLDGVLTRWVFIFSLVFGGLIMATPIVFLKLKAYFKLSQEY